MQCFVYFDFLHIPSIHMPWSSYINAPVVLIPPPPPPRAYIQSMNVCKNAGFGHVIIILFTFLLCICVDDCWRLTVALFPFLTVFFFVFIFNNSFKKNILSRGLTDFFFIILLYFTYIYWLECKTEAGWLRHQINRFRARNFWFIKTKKWNAKQIIIIVKIHTHRHT